MQRGNVTFFENYERRVTDDIPEVTLYSIIKAKDLTLTGGLNQFILRYTPFLNPDMTQPGTNIRDDGSYVRIVRRLKGDGDGSAQ